NGDLSRPQDTARLRRYPELRSSAMSSIRSVPRPEVAPSSVASAWLLVALWTALVWWLGSDLFGAGTASRLLGPLLDWLIPGLPPDRRFAILMTIRKIAHPSIYAVLAGLAFRASLLSGVSGLVRGAAIALAMAISVAGLDEWRQTQTRTRTGAASD